MAVIKGELAWQLLRTPAHASKKLYAALQSGVLLNSPRVLGLAFAWANSQAIEQMAPAWQLTPAASSLPVQEQLRRFCLACSGGLAQGRYAGSIGRINGET